MKKFDSGEIARLINSSMKAMSLLVDSHILMMNGIICKKNLIKKSMDNNAEEADYGRQIVSTKTTVMYWHTETVNMNIQKKRIKEIHEKYGKSIKTMYLYGDY